MSGLRDQILNTNDIAREKVDVPEWNVTIEVRSMTGGERARMIDTATRGGSKDADLTTMYPDVVIACAYDPETGEPVFTEADRALLMSKNSAALDRIALVGMRLSGMGEEAVAAATRSFPDGADGG